MRRFLIDGARDGMLFAESVDASSQAEAEAKALDRLCQAWGLERADYDTLDDMDVIATVRPYMPSDYARDAALEMFDALHRMLPHLKHAAPDSEMGRAYQLGARAFTRAQGAFL